MKPAGSEQGESLPRDPSAALEWLMSEYGSVVLRTAYFYLGDRHHAEDASQEVFLRAYRHWETFRGGSSVKTWLTKITINVCRDKLGLKSATEEPTDPLLMQLTERSGVEEQALNKITKTMVLKHVLNLPAHYHEVVYLYYYMEMTTGEIAEATGAPEGTVRGRLHRARELLGQRLREEESMADETKGTGSVTSIQKRNGRNPV